jgi:hypothetical protein
MKKSMLWYSLLVLAAILIYIPTSLAEVLGPNCKVNARIQRITISGGVAIEGGITNFANDTCNCVIIKLQVKSLSSKSDREGTPIGITSARVTGLRPRIEKKFHAQLLEPRPRGYATADIHSLERCPVRRTTPPPPPRVRPATPPPPRTSATCHISGTLVANTFDPEYVDMQQGIYGPTKRAHLLRIFLVDREDSSAKRRSALLQNAGKGKRRFLFQNVVLGRSYELSLPTGWNFQHGQQTAVRCTRAGSTSKTPALYVRFVAEG